MPTTPARRARATRPSTTRRRAPRSPSARTTRSRSSSAARACCSRRRSPTRAPARTARTGSSTSCAARSCRASRTASTASTPTRTCPRCTSRGSPLALYAIWATKSTWRRPSRSRPCTARAACGAGLRLPRWGACAARSRWWSAECPRVAPCQLVCTRERCRGSHVVRRQL
ncbi:hypothetical protein JKP88DRAFT_227440 [Tribonema minus]|uniref:Uncharacterized protein n=1 Tax=Tribonema minus TaxID=303371 RepID=A0A836C959_9STRA|nr:hypothetical protein JKP88DRAFT_227440 [Tribonema minus]